MRIDEEQKVSIKNAERDFRSVAAIADKSGVAVVFESDRPKYLVVSIESNPTIDLTDDEKIDVAAKRVLYDYKKAFEELAK